MFHKSLQVAPLARCRRRDDGGLKVWRRHAHTEIHPSTTLQCACDVGAARQVAEYDFGSHGAQRFRTLIVATNEGANREMTLAENFNNRAAHPAHLPSGAGHEDRVLI
jgi:hypothetical protein